MGLSLSGFNPLSGVELDNSMGISVWYWYFEILVLDNCMEILVRYWYFGILVLDNCVDILVLY